MAGDEPMTAGAKGCLVALGVGVVLLILGSNWVNHLNDVMTDTHRPRYSADELRERPRLEAVLPEYIEVVTTACEVVGDAPCATLDPTFHRDFSTNHGDQVVDGYPVMAWEPVRWGIEPALPTDEDTIVAVRDALESTLRPYGFELSPDGFHRTADPPHGYYWAVILEDDWGAEVVVRGNDAWTDVSFTSGMHMWSGGDAGCRTREVDPCTPELAVP